MLSSLFSVKYQQKYQSRMPSAGPSVKFLTSAYRRNAAQIMPQAQIQLANARAI
jgi:hypothetical protein